MRDPRRAKSCGDVGGLRVLRQSLFEGRDIARIAFVQARGGDRRGELGADFAREIGAGYYPDVLVMGEGSFRIQKDALAEFRNRSRGNGPKVRQCGRVGPRRSHAR